MIDPFKAKHLRLKLKAVTPLRLSAANATRWNSQLASFIRLHQLSRHVDSIAHSDRREAAIQVSVDEWKALAEIIQLLTPYKNATDIVQSNHATVADVFLTLCPCINFQYTAFVTPEFNTEAFKSGIIRILKFRYLRYINIGLVRLALQLSYRWDKLHRTYQKLLPMNPAGDDEVEMMR